MGDKPVFRVGVAGLDARDLRLIDIVFRHSQYNRYEFRLADAGLVGEFDILIANVTASHGQRAMSQARGRGVPIVEALPRGAVGAIGPAGTTTGTDSASATGPGAHSIAIGRLTLQLLPVLNRVVEADLLAPASADRENEHEQADEQAHEQAHEQADEQDHEQEHEQAHEQIQPAPAHAEPMRAVGRAEETSDVEPARSDAREQAPTLLQAAEPLCALDEALPSEPLRRDVSDTDVGATPEPRPDVPTDAPLPREGVAEPRFEDDEGLRSRTAGFDAYDGTSDTTSESTHSDVRDERPVHVDVDENAYAYANAHDEEQDDRHDEAADEAADEAEGDAREDVEASSAAARSAEGWERLRALPEAPSPAHRSTGASEPSHAGGRERPAPEAASAAPRSNLVAFPVGEGTITPRLRVLVVDDSPTVRRQLTVAFDRLGLGCETVDSAARAHERLAAQHFDLALIDVVMPDCDGYKLTREIKRNKRLRQMPVIILTSRSSPFDLARGALSGCDAYLTKPVPFRALESAVVKQLQRSLAIDDLTGMMRLSGSPALREPTRAESRVARLFRR